MNVLTELYTVFYLSCSRNRIIIACSSFDNAEVFATISHTVDDLWDLLVYVALRFSSVVYYVLGSAPDQCRQRRYVSTVGVYTSVTYFYQNCCFFRTIAIATWQQIGLFIFRYLILVAPYINEDASSFTLLTGDLATQITHDGIIEPGSSSPLILRWSQYQNEEPSYIRIGEATG